MERSSRRGNERAKLKISECVRVEAATWRDFNMGENPWNGARETNIIGSESLLNVFIINCTTQEKADTQQPSPAPTAAMTCSLLMKSVLA